MTPLHCWTVYRRPRDFPRSYVARRFRLVDGATIPEGEVRIAPSLEAVRGLIPPEFTVRMPRHAADDPVIVETWW